jgi:aspartate aminotransferase-like enzyme
MPLMGTDDWEQQFEANIDSLRRLFATGRDQHVIMANGRGSDLMRATARACLAPGDVAVVLANGVFGIRFAEGVRSIDAQPIVVEFDACRSLDPSAVCEVLRNHSDARAVFFVALESTYGVLSDIAAVARAARLALPEALIVADAVPLLGAGPIEFSRADLDVAIGVSHKALGAHPGLAFVATSERFLAWRATARRAGRWSELDAAYEANQDLRMDTSPVPAAWITGSQALAAVRNAQKSFDRHQRRAILARETLRAAGFTPIVRDCAMAPTVTGCRVPPGIDAVLLARRAWERHGVRVVAGRGEARNHALRIAHMGWLREEDLLAGIDLLATTAGAAAPKEGM